MSAAALLTVNDFPWSLWTDRDMYRALHKGVDFWFVGPELTQGARTPGGFYYIYLDLLYRTAGSLFGVYQMMILLNAVALFALFIELRNHASTTSSLWALAFVAAQVFTSSGLTQLWNPAFGLPFLCLAFAFTLKWLRKKETVFLIISILLLGGAAQLHVSFLYPAITDLLLALVGMGRPSFRRFSAVAGCLLVVYLPYLFYIGYVAPASLEDFGKFAEYRQFHDRQDLIQDLKSSLGTLFALNFQPIEFFEVSKSGRIGNLLAKTDVPFLDEDVIRHALGLIRYLVKLSFLVFFVVGVLITSRGVCKKIILNQSLGKQDWLFLSLFGAVVILTLGHSILLGAPKTRYLYWTMPIVFVVAAIVLDNLVKHIQSADQRWFSEGGGVIVSVFLISYSVLGLNGVWKYNPVGLITPQYSQIAEISEALSEKFSLDADEWGKRVAGFYYNTPEMSYSMGSNVGYQPFGYYFSGDFFAYQVVSVQNPGGLARGRCILAFEVRPETQEVASFVDVRRTLVEAGFDDKLRDLRREYQGTNFTYYTFDASSSSCPRNLRNNYVLLQEERELAQYLSTMESDVQVFPAGRVTDNHRVSRVVFRIGYSTKIALMLEIVQGPEGQKILLNSRELRSFDGTKSFVFRNPSITFRSLESGKEYQEPIYRGEFGSSYSRRLLVSTPWTVAIKTVPPGHYSVHFSAVDFMEFVDENWT